MNTPPPPDLSFLQGEPEPVGRARHAGSTPSPDDVLPQNLADALLAIAGVDGAWIERDAAGQRFVALHCAGTPVALPEHAHGLPVRVVGRGPIRAGG
jgi:hypothetical protein